MNIIYGGFFMKNVDLNADIRNSSRSKQSRKLKRENKIPAILYEKNSPGRMLKLDEREVNNLISKHGENIVVMIHMMGEEVPAVIKEIQRDPSNNRLVHIDFQPVSIHEVIHAEVPILVVNGERVSKSGWVINKQLGKIEVEGEVEKIPASIIVDATKIKKGGVFRVSDIEVSEELSVINAGDEVILSILQSKSEPIDLVFDREEPELVTREKEDKIKEKQE
jgi:large subunit ribosomal protein L25